jgi:hypothetical protein
VSPTTLRRLAGGTLVAQFGLCLAGGLLHPVVDGRAHSPDALLAPLAPASWTLLLTGTVLLVMAMPAAVSYLAPHVGRVGTVAALVHLAALLVVVVPHLAVESMVAPVLAADPRAVALVDPADGIVDSPLFLAVQTVGGLVMMLSLAVLGVTVVRSSLPTWIGIAMIAALVLIVTPLPVAPLLTGLQVEVPRGLAMAGVGLLLLRSARRSPAAPAHRQVVAA